jgi:DNA replication and repair protein RecF
MRHRLSATQAVTPAARRIAGALGLTGDFTIVYRPRSRAAEPDELFEELQAHREADIERGFSAHGPHRDDLVLRLADRELRAYGSQGQQRISLLALLLAEREAIAELRGTPPVMLLDDVMSELDHIRREALVDLLRGAGGQAIVTTTDLEHVPGASDDGVMRIAISEGAVLEEAAV